MPDALIKKVPGEFAVKDAFAGLSITGATEVVVTVSVPGWYSSE